MKHIPSFYFKNLTLLCFFLFSPFFLYSQEKDISWGVNLKKEIVSATFWSSKSWGILLNPLKSIQIDLGHNSDPGVWSSLSSPKFTMANPISLSSISPPQLFRSLAKENSTKTPVSGCISFTTKHLFLTSIFHNSGYKICTGFQGSKNEWAFCLFFGSSYQYKKERIDNSWFPKKQEWEKGYYLTFLQEVTIQTPIFNSKFITGQTENPKGKPLSFFKTEHLLHIKAFSLYANFFICDYGYLTQGNISITDTLQWQIKPRLSFTLPFNTPIDIIGGITFFSEYSSPTIQTKTNVALSLTREILNLSCSMLFTEKVLSSSILSFSLGSLELSMDTEYISPIKKVGKIMYVFDYEKNNFLIKFSSGITIDNQDSTINFNHEETVGIQYQGLFPLQSQKITCTFSKSKISISYLLTL
jgi:hypothetical protein